MTKNSHDQYGNLHTLKEIALVETDWGIYYSVYIDARGRYWYDLDDDGFNVQEADAGTKEEAIKALKAYLNSIEDEYDL